jgi:hypothetical protein
MSTHNSTGARFLRSRTAPAFVLAIASASLIACAGADRSGSATASSGAATWQEDFNLANRTLTDSGASKYFVLRPGFQLVLAGGGTQLTITVLDETKRIRDVVTRVVEEREEKNGQLVEVSRNFFAIDPKTGDVFYFGEDVDDYEGGRLVDHSGAWLAYAGANKPGMIMPGTPQVGMRYFQEVAPGVAMDRAEVMSTTGGCSTPAGQFQNCLVTRETSPLEPTVTEQKIYAPGIGLVQDQSLKLVRYGDVK